MSRITDERFFFFSEKSINNAQKTRQCPRKLVQGGGCGQPSLFLRRQRASSLSSAKLTRPHSTDRKTSEGENRNVRNLMGSWDGGQTRLTPQAGKRVHLSSLLASVISTRLLSKKHTETFSPSLACSFLEAEETLINVGEKGQLNAHNMICKGDQVFRFIWRWAPSTKRVLFLGEVRLREAASLLFNSTTLNLAASWELRGEWSRIAVSSSSQQTNEDGEFSPVWLGAITVHNSIEKDQYEQSNKVYSDSKCRVFWTWCSVCRWRRIPVFQTATWCWAKENFITLQEQRDRNKRVYDVFGKPVSLCIFIKRHKELAEIERWNQHEAEKKQKYYSLLNSSEGSQISSLRGWKKAIWTKK